LEISSVVDQMQSTGEGRTASKAHKGLTARCGGRAWMRSSDDKKGSGVLLLAD
jgi:hypothetical protein